ncbi:MAG: hypothetical protein KBF37_09160 [Saprospiraceae bacterium]|jgi:hypothetical protein|nr:hypothetical protein [Saprospiraceae bacterium]MBP9210474.1 hypothetical protein [Saprospiraceae bacterium]
MNGHPIIPASPEHFHPNILSQIQPGRGLAWVGIPPSHLVSPILPQECSAILAGPDA